jgi:hypothetical protein
VIFALAPDVEVLDLAGPVQAFHEANRCVRDAAFGGAVIARIREDLRLPEVVKYPP